MEGEKRENLKVPTRTEIEEMGKQYEKMIVEKMALKPNHHNCHDCGVKPGNMHKEGCDSPICSICGVQLLQCGHWKWGNSVHTGIESQEVKILAQAMGLYSKFSKDGWTKTGENDPDGYYDLNEACRIYQLALMKVREREMKR